MKRLVVNGDDFGMCHSVNEGTVLGFREGILTQSSLMVPCPWFEEAVSLAKEHGIPVGVHLTATGEWDRYRWRPITPARSFVEADGTLPCSIERVQERADLGELETEFCAQVELVMDRGIQPSYLDVHMGVVNAQVVASVVRRFGIRCRYPFAEGYDDCLFPFDSYSAVTGVERKTGLSKKEWLRQYLAGLNDGLHFLCCHLAIGSPEMRAVSSTESVWTETYRAGDLEAIRAPEIKTLCRELDIKLIALNELES